MAGKILKFIRTLTPVGGTISENTTEANGYFGINSTGGYIESVFLKPVSSDTVFDFYITSPAGNIVFRRLDNIGQLNEIVHLPVFGTYTLTIANSTVNEAFAMEIGFKEEKG